jgi:hypothetical protein
VVSPTSHHRQWSRASFKISGDEWQFLSQHSEDRKSNVSGSAPRRLFGTHTRDNARHARCTCLFAIQAVQYPTHCEWGSSPHINNIDPLGVAR